MKEIGGYFGLEETKGNKEYYQNLIAINTARNALVYVVKARNINKLYIPYYLCDSVSRVLDRENIKYDFYHIDENFNPIFEKDLGNDEYLYIVNYYGLKNNIILSRLKNKYNNIIIDNIHAFFQEPLLGVDTIYSCRKFFGVPDGAYLYTDKLIRNNLSIDNSEQRMKHIYGRPKDGASAHYNEFKENDEAFYDLKLMYMSKLTHLLLKNIDYEYCIKRRNENFAYLHNELKTINKIGVPNDINGPYAYPLLVENGMEIKKKLAKKGIYVATLWPNVIGLGGLEEYYAKNFLPIPCDQRYNIDDMKFVVEVFLNEYKR